MNSFHSVRVACSIGGENEIEHFHKERRDGVFQRLPITQLGFSKEKGPAEIAIEPASVWDNLNW